TVYFIASHTKSDQGYGVVNAEAFVHGMQDIENSLQTNGMQKTFEMLASQPPKNDLFRKYISDLWIDQNLDITYVYLNPMYWYQWGGKKPIIKWSIYFWYLLGVMLALFYLLKRAQPAVIHETAGQTNKSNYQLQSDL